MIGAFARMLGSRERLLSYEETAERGLAVQARTDAGEDSVREGHDSPPEAFVERIPDEGGDVYVVPLLEAMRQWFRRRREEPEAAATVPSLPENAEESPEARE